jgi:hypothetical protein
LDTGVGGQRLDIAQADEGLAEQLREAHPALPGKPTDAR